MSALLCSWYTQNHYDRRGRVVRQELETGEEFVIFYDDAAKQNTFLTGSTGENVIYSYGREKLPTQVLYHDGTTECYRYDSGRNIIYEKDRLGRETTRLYNEKGQPVKEQFPDGYTRYTEYNAIGLPARIYDNAGRETINTYDECGNLVKNSRKIDESAVRETTFAHDSRGRTVKVCGADGSVQEYRYDTLYSGPSEYKDGTGNVTVYEYDGRNRLVSVINPDGATEHRYVYDPAGNLIKDIPAKGFLMADNDRDRVGTVYEYDLTGSLYESQGIEIALSNSEIDTVFRECRQRV